MLSLPRFPTDCLRRAEPSRGRPLVLWEKVKGAMRIAALDAEATRRGLGVGHSLADAHAQVPDLDAREIDTGYLAHAFAELADWHTNASPHVAVLDERRPYGELCLDITGVSHLFGGEAGMLDRLTGRLQKAGFTTRGAIADTVGAAWALAHFAPGRIVMRHESPEALADLPVAALRLDDRLVAGLGALGLKQVGQLYGRDRRALQARFGPHPIVRLDQALGHIEERITPRPPVAEHVVERRFAEPIGLIDDVLACANDLAVTLAHRLEAGRLGAQSFHLLLYLVDHRLVRLSVNASRPTRDAGHIGRLFQHRAERLAGEYDPGFGIDLIRLAAGSISELDSAQAGMFGEAGSADLEKLFDRITSRLGPLAVVRLKPVDTHIPERAAKLEPVLARTADDPRAAPDPDVPRPLRLLPTPEPVTVLAAVPDGPPITMTWRRVAYRFARVSGPERIEAEWWRSGKRLALADPHGEMEKEGAGDGLQVPADPPPHPAPRATFSHGGEKGDGGSPSPSASQSSCPGFFIPETVVRDYYVAEDVVGRRYWLFRLGLYGASTPTWFLHGLFA